MRDRRVRLWFVLAALGIIVGAVWVFIPVPFVRGLVTGAVVGPAALLGGLALITRRIRKRMKVGGGLKPPPLPVGRWDFDMSVQDVDGNRLDFADFSGQVLILNFWATWCGPCVAEMPSLSRLREATSDVEVALACVTREPVEKVREFLDKRDADMPDVPFYVLDGDVPECFTSRGIPATFVLDKRGTIVLRHFGAAAWDDESVVGFIRGLALAPEL